MQETPKSARLVAMKPGMKEYEIYIRKENRRYYLYEKMIARVARLFLPPVDLFFV
jgi:hypothetical protein